MDFLNESTFKSLVKVSEVPKELLEDQSAGHEGSEAKAKGEQVGSWDDSCESWEDVNQLFDAGLDAYHKFCPRAVVNGVILGCCSSCITRFSS